VLRSERTACALIRPRLAEPADFSMQGLLAVCEPESLSNPGVRCRDARHWGSTQRLYGEAMTAIHQADEGGILRAKPARGRPPRTTTTPDDSMGAVWRHVERMRRQHELSTGKLLSVRETCRQIIEAGGGLFWIVGGDRDSIIKDMKTPGSSLSRARRYRAEPTVNGQRLVADKNGSIIATHAITCAQSLRARYAEANRFVLRCPSVREAWTNMVNDSLGLPRQPPKERGFAS